jgi:osmotically-inducible protein OsmY
MMRIQGSRTAILATLLLLVVLAPVTARAADDRLLGRRLQDMAITALVKTRLVTARPASMIHIDVDTNEGVVRLRGTVPGEREWAEAERLAGETPGVKRVWNELQFEDRTQRAGP